MNSRNIDSSNVELLIQLIELYVETINVYSAKLSKDLEIDNLAEWRSAGVPIRGTFGGEWTYAFHGTGCCITSPEMDVDFEFGLDCGVGGFDVWRLWVFVCDNESICADFLDFSDKKRLKQSFQEAARGKLISGPVGELYYLSSEK